MSLMVVYNCHTDYGIHCPLARLQHRTQRHQSLAEWQRERKERQCLSPSRCSNTSKGTSLWHTGSRSARKSSASLPHAAATHAKATAFRRPAAETRGKAAPVSLSLSSHSAARKGSAPFCLSLSLCLSVSVSLSLCSFTWAGTHSVSVSRSARSSAAPHVEGNPR